MRNTTFHNASGLPDPGQVTTRARHGHSSAARCRTASRSTSPISRRRASPIGGSRIPNHNHLLGRVDGVNGIKTGYTRASGYNLVTSVDRDGRKLVAVVLGGRTGSARDQRMASLVNTYIGKASQGRGPRRRSPRLLTTRRLPQRPGARRRQSPTSRSPLPTPTPAPLPRTRPAAAVARVPLQYHRPAADQTGSVAFATAFAETDTGEGDIGDGDVLAAAAAAVPKSVKTTRIVIAKADAATMEDAGAAPVETAKPAPVASAGIPAGWKIQIAATPTEAAAKSLLDAVRAKGGKVLADASGLHRAGHQGYDHALSRPLRRLRQQERCPRRLRLPHQAEDRVSRPVGLSAD